MRDARAFTRANGWPILLSHAVAGAKRRVRDRLTAQRLRAPGFRAGRAPRLLGLSHIRLEEDFHAGDALWLEAVLLYGESSFSPELVIGAHARLSDSVHIACLRQISIGRHFLCGSRVLISDHLHGRYDESVGASDPAIPPALRSLYSPDAVRIADNVWVGDGAVILGGAHIGEGSVIGANSVVNAAIPPRTIAVGSPARPVRRWNQDLRCWQPWQSAAESGLVD